MMTPTPRHRDTGSPAPRSGALAVWPVRDVPSTGALSRRIPSSLVLTTVSAPLRTPEARPHVTERGAVAITLAICMVALIGLAGLVVDGSRALAARSRAHDLAEQAARTAAGQLSETSLRQGSPDAVRLQTTAATQAARTVLQAADATGEATVDGQEVTVTATVAERPLILTLVGIRDLNATSTATAALLHGTTEGTR